MSRHGFIAATLGALKVGDFALRRAFVAQTSAVRSLVDKLQWSGVGHDQDQLQLDLVHNSGAFVGEQEPSLSASDVLADGFMLMAVPKRKTTPSRRRVRQHDKFPQNIQNITTCHKCGGAKLLHALCWACTKKIMAQTAAIRRTDPAFTIFKDKASSREHKIKDIPTPMNKKSFPEKRKSPLPKGPQEE
ncbi:hypothetical protein SARC_01062 [Sphaeroforma arctica JP610]|uniref:Large ribosomal subunit protein bL32m n=1 Tax=Sphaeroforma arctica JP610 TaxID=667725 RepID=A0A0L0GCQ8_9EUKA|nr:hypothetical protein SARC_01062 [Sphaeroforma arctica JP610]KNC86800.1 hypothetical protein SARC_01062 [Sphaeroforma arctica JP610]|eukprot:XP_014160702.1 hypothetical protein SARC_01062 [Sphaeroforma arctica JP610]